MHARTKMAKHIRPYCRVYVRLTRVSLNPDEGSNSSVEFVGHHVARKHSPLDVVPTLVLMLAWGGTPVGLTPWSEGATGAVVTH